MANRTAVIQTNKGTIRVELLESDAPKTTENFITLAERGYYDGIIAALRRGDDAQAVADAVGDSPWGTNSFNVAGLIG